MRYLTLAEVLELHRQVIEQSGGASGVRDLGLLESAVAQPRMTFEKTDLYPTLEEKAAALCFSLVNNHPFVDGNKRVGHAAMETFLVLNAHEIGSTRRRCGGNRALAGSGNVVSRGACLLGSGAPGSPVRTPGAMRGLSALAVGPPGNRQFFTCYAAC